MKIKQIAIVQNTDATHACIYALTEDGKIIFKRLGFNDWYFETTPEEGNIKTLPPVPEHVQ